MALGPALRACVDRPDAPAPGDGAGGFAGKARPDRDDGRVRDAREDLLESVTRMMGDLYRVAGFEEVAQHVEYVLATQPDEYRPLFVRALRRNVPGRGGDVLNYVEQLIERGRREGLEDGFKEGRREGELKVRIRTIEGFLGRAVPWSTIEAATGINEAAFRKLKQHVDADDEGPN